MNIHAKRTAFLGEKVHETGKKISKATCFLFKKFCVSYLLFLQYAHYIPTAAFGFAPGLPAAAVGFTLGFLQLLLAEHRLPVAAVC